MHTQVRAGSECSAAARHAHVHLRLRVCVVTDDAGGHHEPGPPSSDPNTQESDLVYVLKVAGASIAGA